jgi:chromatin modification-related protein VID21
MQADFREEKKWKMTLAFELAQAVAEWHLASPEERMNLRGYYQAPEFPGPAEPIERGVPQEEKEEEDLPEKPEIVQDTEGDSSEEDEVQAVISKESDKEAQAMEVVPTEPVFTMKTEETDQANMANLANPEDDDRKPDMSQDRELDDSKNPIMFTSNLDTKDTADQIAQDFREVENLITKLDSSSLWVDPTELEALVHPPKEEKPSVINLEWDKSLPDFPVYSMDAPPDIPDALRKDEVQSETIPISRFADSQPLLLGALQPALRLQDGVWQTFDQTPVSAEEGKRPTPLSSRTSKPAKRIVMPHSDRESSRKELPDHFS